jgi:predicted transcriptional regulator
MVRLTKEKDILRVETRNRIYHFILINPGLHLSELSKKLEIPKTTLFYHINYLKKHNLILEKTSLGFCRYYGKMKVSENNKKIFSVLRQEIPRRIMIYLIFLHEDYVTQNEISKYLNKHPTTISFHLNKLIEIGMLERITIGKETKYKINYEHDIYDFFIKYNKTILDDVLPFAINWWNYKIQSDRIDNIIEFFQEIFPHPYYV